MLKFSIIIPAYNAEKTIKNCIKSVQEQTYTNWELIVIDDGSSDRTAEFARKVLPYVDVYTKENAGVSSARNFGIDLAKGDFLLFLDADDYFPKNTLELYEQAIKSESNSDVIFGSFYKVYSQKEKLCNPVGNDKIYVCDSKRKEFDPYISRLMGTVWGKCYKSTLINDVRFDECLSMCEDAEFNYRVLKKAKKLVYLSQPIYSYVYSSTSTIRKYSDNNLNKYIVATNKIFLENKDTFLRSNVLEFICTVFNVICFNLVFTNQNKQHYSQKVKVLRELKNTISFEVAIKEVDVKKLNFKHRLSILFARYNIYFGLYLMSLINQILNKIMY